MSEIDREDALDCALSGQSYTERLIDSVCAELNAMAVDLKISHTVNGSWPAGEQDTLEKHDHLRRMAAELRKLKVLPEQAARESEGGEAVADFDTWWDNKARYHDHRSTKALARAAYKQGFSDGYTHPQPAQQGSMPEIIKAIADKLEKVEGESADGGYMWDARECAEFIREEADRLSATPQPEGDGWTPRGWKLLPVHATEDMVRRGKRAHGEEFLFNKDPDSNIQGIWKAMLAVAPQPPQRSKGDGCCCGETEQAWRLCPVHGPTTKEQG